MPICCRPVPALPAAGPRHYCGAARRARVSGGISTRPRRPLTRPASHRPSCRCGWPRAEAHWLQGEPHLAAQETELADDVAAHAGGRERGEIGVWLRRTMSDRSSRGELAEPYRLQVAGGWEEAARLWVSLGCPYAAALALHDANQEVALRRALRMFHDLGAPAAAGLTRQKMRRLGIRSIPAGPRSATRSDPLGLTRREREVLDLICARNTNAAIAAKLFISAKTVDHHVSAVLAKLKRPDPRGRRVARRPARPGGRGGRLRWPQCPGVGTMDRVAALWLYLAAPQGAAGFRPAPTRHQYLPGSLGTSAGESGRHSGT